MNTDTDTDINYEQILKVLELICTDEKQKTSDRITAAKLLLEHTADKNEKSDGTLTVAFENVPIEFCE